MASMEDSDMSFQQQEGGQSDTSNDLTSFQFVPDKIVDFSITPDGQRSYRVRWKDSWLTEELLSLTYQHLINEFWSSAAAATANKSNDKTKKNQKGSNIKIVGKQDQYDSGYPTISPNEQTTITVTSGNNMDGRNDVQTVNLKDISEAATAAHLLDGNGMMKQNVMPKMQNQVNSNSLSSLVVNSDVSLASSLQYPDMPPTMLTNPPIPKYQQALQQSMGVPQTDLAENTETGRVTFPKHVFSQARFVNKKQQQQIAASEQPRVSCDICDKSLKTKKMLWAHKVAVHFGGNFPCEICGKKCITAAELRRHMTSHSSERKFVCQYCGLAYKRWSHLYQHLRVHEEEKNFRCDVCHINFKVQSELKDHCFAEHALGEVVQCSVCKHNLQTPLAVYHHSMKHTGTRDFICEICGSNFKRKQHLVTHMKTHLTEKKTVDGSNETYECQACDQTFQLKMEMKSHCDTAHPLPDDESVMCKTCQKKLNVPSSVYLHGLRHCGSRDFQCDECNQLFKRKAHLLRHKADRHPHEPKERKKRSTPGDAIVCTLCRKTFKYRNALVKHMAGQHGVLPKSDLSAETEIVFRKGIKRPHQCAQCLKRFKSKGSLGRHKLNKHNIGSEVDISVQPGDAGSSKDISGEGNIKTESEGIDSAGAIKSENQMISESFQLEVEDDHGSTSASGSGNIGSQSVSIDNIPHQVITVDQETGQIILMESSNQNDSSNITSGAQSDRSKVVTVQGSGAQQNAARVHASGGQATSYNSDVSDLSALSQADSQFTNPVSIGQIINQAGVALTSVPIQSVQGLPGENNIIDFSQGNNEQIVVLLSALNSQNMQDM